MKAKTKAVWKLVLVMFACAAGGCVNPSHSGEPAAYKGEKTPAPALDRFGDPLPAGAIARLGSVRLRHGDYLISIRFAPDGKTLISLGRDGVRVWDAATGKPVRHFGGGVQPAFLDLSSDGRRIALSRWHAGIGGPVEVWDAATGRLLQKMGNRHYSRVRFSPDGKQLAALNDNLNLGFGEVEWHIDLWHAGTGRDIRTLAGGKECVSDMVYSADGKTLLLGGSGKAISLRSTADGKETRRFGDLPAEVISSIGSPQGDRIACIEFWQATFPGGGRSWGQGTRVFLLDARTGAELRRWSGKPEFEGNVLQNGWWSLAFSPDGRRLAACQRDGPIRIWDTDSGAEKRLLPDGRMHSGGVAFSSDGKTLAVGDGGQMIRLIDAQTGADRLPAQGRHGRVTNLALSRDGKTAFTAVEEGAIHRWDVRTGREHEWHLDPKARASGLLLSPDGRILLLHTNTERRQSWECWDIDSRAQRWRQEDPGCGSWSRITLSPDGTTLATGGGDSTILKLMKTSTGETLHDLQAKAPIWSIAFAPDGSTVFALTGRWIVRRWETSSGRPLPDLRLPAASGEPSLDPNAQVVGESAALSPDGRFAAYAQDDKILRIFDVFGQREAHHFAELPGPVAMMAFAPDGRTFVWAERSGVLHWLELASGGERRTLPGHAGAVSQFVFDNDGKHLVTSSDDATALVWDLIGQGPTKLSAEQRDACWSALAEKDAAKAYRTMSSLIAAPADALALLRSHLKAIEGVDDKRIERLIADLDSDAFAVRDKATKELRKLGELAEPAFRQALAARPSLEMNRRLQGLLDEVAQHHWQPSAGVLRQLRAIEVLERVGTPEAQSLLETLARGAKGARQTQEARAAVLRLQSTGPAKK